MLEPPGSGLCWRWPGPCVRPSRGADLHEVVLLAVGSAREGKRPAACGLEPCSVLLGLPGHLPQPGHPGLAGLCEGARYACVIGFRRCHFSCCGQRKSTCIATPDVQAPERVRRCDWVTQPGTRSLAMPP